MPWSNPIRPIGRPQAGMTMVNPFSQRRWSWEQAGPGAALAQAPPDDAKKALFRAKLTGLAFGVVAGGLLTWIFLRRKTAHA